MLEEMREAIRSAAPEAEESISYGMPTFKIAGRPLVYFAAWKRHIGFYPVPRLDEELETEITRYRSGRDTLRFPRDQPIPYRLVERIVTTIKSAPA